MTKVRDSRRLLPFSALILVSAFWGIHAVVGKAVEARLGPFDLTVLRFTFGALFYSPFLARMRRLPRRILWQLAFTGLLWAVLYPLFFYQSLRFITPVEGLLFINTAPLIAALLGRLLLGERMRPTQWAGIGIAFVGVGWTTFGQWKSGHSTAGVALVLIAAFAFAAYTVSSRSLTKNLALLDMVAATSIFGAVELWAITLLIGQTQGVLSSLTRLGPKSWIEFLYVVIIVSTISYILYGYAVKRVSAAVSSALTFYPQVLFAALVQWMWLGVTPAWTIAVSAALILGGVVVMQWPERGRQVFPQTE